MIPSDNNLTIPAPAFDYVLSIAPMGRELVKIGYDGVITYGPDYKPDEAARAFWQGVAGLVPDTVSKLAAENARLLKEISDAQNAKADAECQWRGRQEEVDYLSAKLRESRDYAEALVAAFHRYDDAHEACAIAWDNAEHAPLNEAGDKLVAIYDAAVMAEAEAMGALRDLANESLAKNSANHSTTKGDTMEDLIPAAQVELPRYRCHKEVWALKIKEIRQAPAEQERVNAGGDWYLVPEDGIYAPILVGHDEYVLRHKPEAGGYYVVYADGYKSYSPAAPFESGYTRI